MSYLSTDVNLDELFHLQIVIMFIVIKMVTFNLAREYKSRIDFYLW